MVCDFCGILERCPKFGKRKRRRTVVWVGRGERRGGSRESWSGHRNSVQRPQVAASVSYTSSIKDLIESLSFSVFFSAIISLPHLRARVHVLERNVGGSSVETPMSSSSFFSLPPSPPNLITHRFRILV